MDNAFTVNELILLAAFALLAADIISVWYLRKSRHKEQESIHSAKEYECAPSKKNEEPEKEKSTDPPSLIITVRRSAVPDAVLSKGTERSESTETCKPGYWCCRYCQTLSPDDTNICVACGHRKR